MKNRAINRPSMKDIAEIANVSTATVSHVINRTRFVSDDITARVRAAMEEVGYYPNLLARGLRNQLTKTIGFIIPDIGNPYYTALTEGVEGILKEHGYHMILSNSYEDVANEAEIIKLYNSLQIDGLVMVPAPGDQSGLKKLFADRYPIMFVDRRPRGLVGDYAILENEQSTYKAIRYLIEKGHRRIALVVGDPLLSTSYDRIQGYGRACRDHGIPVDQSLIIPGSFSYDCGYQIAERLVQKDDLTAMFFANEMMTIGAIACLKKHGVKIPKEMAIISCNDSKWTEIADPPLTVVSQPAKELGKRATELLIQRIENGEELAEEPIDICLPTEIIVRQSC